MDIGEIQKEDVDLLLAREMKSYLYDSHYTWLISSSSEAHRLTVQAGFRVINQIVIQITKL